MTMPAPSPRPATVTIVMPAPIAWTARTAWTMGGARTVGSARTTRPRDQRQGGFTLIEIMLALALMAFVTSLLWGTFAQTTKVKQRIEAAQDRTHTVRVALMRMSREIEMAYRSGSDAIGTADRRTMFSGIAHNDFDELRFSWLGHQRLRADATEGDTALVSYFPMPDPDDPMVTNLMRRETKRLEAKDPKLMSAETYILCPAVVRLKLAYYDYKQKDWREEWDTTKADGQQYLPTQVRISLTVMDERGMPVTFISVARLHVLETVDYRSTES
jgi:general secretion pathway protein J